MFHRDALLLTTSGDTLAEVGKQAAGFPADEWFAEVGPSGQVEGPRYELTYRDESGAERPATADEDTELFRTRGDEAMKAMIAAQPPCPRCGLRVAEQKHPYPVRATPDGPVCWGCWTDEEREQAPEFREFPRPE